MIITGRGEVASRVFTCHCFSPLNPLTVIFLPLNLPPNAISLTNRGMIVIFMHYPLPCQMPPQRIVIIISLYLFYHLSGVSPPATSLPTDTHTGSHPPSEVQAFWLHPPIPF